MEEILNGIILVGFPGAIAAISWLLPDPFVTAKRLLKTAKPGDLIEFDRGVYRHWAMYSDTYGLIINIPAESKDVDKVKITYDDLLDVAQHSGVRVNNLEDVAKKMGYKKRSAEDSLKAAKKDLGQTLPYNFLKTNCEYYSTKWLYGDGFSVQALHGVPKVKLGVTGLPSRLDVYIRQGFALSLSIIDLYFTTVTIGTINRVTLNTIYRVL